MTSNNESSGYTFPMLDAIQCIPEYSGSVDELDIFLAQIEYFAKQFPAQANQAPLLNVVLMKLKGKAATYVDRVKAKTWDEMVTKLKAQFGKSITAEGIFEQIVTLDQNSNEPFEEYVDRALKIKENIDELENQREQKHVSIVEKGLRIHFIGGMRNKDLKQSALAQRSATFNDMMKFLKEVRVENELHENIDKRLQAYRMIKHMKAQNNIQEPLNNSHSGHENFSYRNHVNNEKFTQFSNNQEHNSSKHENNNFDNSENFSYSQPQSGINQIAAYNRRKYDNYNQNIRCIPNSRRYQPHQTSRYFENHNEYTQNYNTNYNRQKNLITGVSNTASEHPDKQKIFTKDAIEIIILLALILYHNHIRVELTQYPNYIHVMIGKLTNFQKVL